MALINPKSSIIFKKLNIFIKEFLYNKWIEVLIKPSISFYAKFHQLEELCHNKT